MREQKQTHWKKNFNYNYLGAYSLGSGEEVTLTIISVNKEKITAQKGAEEECTIARFKEDVNGEKKPMILNKTNCKIIEKIYKTPYIENWIGKKITIYIDPRIKAFGDIVEALRIRPQQPKELEVLTKESKHYERTKNAWNDGKQKAVKSRFVITSEIEKSFTL